MDWRQKKKKVERDRDCLAHKLKVMRIRQLLDTPLPATSTTVCVHALKKTLLFFLFYIMFILLLAVVNSFCFVLER